MLGHAITSDCQARLRTRLAGYPSREPRSALAAEDKKPAQCSGHPLAILGDRIGMLLLDLGLGHLLQCELLHEIADALDEGYDPSLPFAGESPDDENHRDADTSMIEHWCALCFHLGALPHGHFLNSQKIKVHGGAAKSAAEVLGLTAQDLQRIWEVLEPASIEQVEALANFLGVDRDEITSPDPWAEVLALMANPRYKNDIKARPRVTNLSEGDVRLAVRSEYGWQQETTAHH